MLTKINNDKVFLFHHHYLHIKNVSHIHSQREINQNVVWAERCQLLLKDWRSTLCLYENVSSSTKKPDQCVNHYCVYTAFMEYYSMHSVCTLRFPHTQYKEKNILHKHKGWLEDIFTFFLRRKKLKTVTFSGFLYPSQLHCPLTAAAAVSRSCKWKTYQQPSAIA